MALTLPLLLFAGCTGSDATPTEAASTTATTSAPPSTSATPTPTPSGPVIPDAARTQDEKGGVAFVKFFVDQVNESYTTPRDDLIPALSHPECKSCVELQRYAKEYVASESHTSDAPYSATDVKWVGEQSAGVFIITMTFKTHPVDTIDSTGKVVSTYAADSTQRRIGVTWRGGQWLIFGAAADAS